MLERLGGLNEDGADEERHPEHDAAVHERDRQARRARHAERRERHHHGSLHHAYALRRDRDHGEQRGDYVAADERFGLLHAERHAHQAETGQLASAGRNGAAERLRRCLGVMRDKAGSVGKRAHKCRKDKYMKEDLK